MRLFLCTLIWMALLPVVLADPARICVAVVSDADSRDLAALVTTELSNNSDLSLVERNDLSKAGDELKLQQLAGADSVALGKLVGANGLLFIDKSPDGIRLRFTAVDLGYALFDDLIPGDPDLPKLAKSMGHRVAGYTSKLKLDPAKAISISVLNIRADYSTPESTALERNLTLLLESRLASVPEYVVLERRHAWSLGFEHSLDPAAHSLLRGAYLIEGTLSLPADSSGTCAISIQIRFPDGHQDKASIQGNAGNPALLADQLLALIQKTLGKTVSLAQPEAEKEAREYLREGLWGRHAHAFDAGLEALDSAELLGARIADIEVERIPILYAMADEGLGNWYPLFDGEDKTPVFDGPGLNRRADVAIRALHEAARYQDEKMEDAVDPALLTDPTEKFLARTDRLQAWTVYRASKVLYLLDCVNSPRADELRQALRPVTDYDPLHGRAGRDYPTNVNNDTSRTQFADDWAQSLEEELAYYRLVCTDKVMAIPFSQVSWNLDYFGKRFLKTPEERRKAFAAFVESLKDQPDSRLTYDLLRTHSPDAAVADAGYKDFIGELWNSREDLVAASSDLPIFHNLHSIPDSVKMRNAAARLPLLHYFLASPNLSSRSVGVLRALWEPEGFPETEAPQLWAEYKLCRDRLLEKLKPEGRERTAWEERMGEMADKFRAKFPSLAGAPSAAAPSNADALSVTKFWQPWQASSEPKSQYQLLALAPCTDGIWVKGIFIHDAYPLGIFHVNLNTFTTDESPAPPIKHSPSEIAVTSSAVYLRGSPEDNGGKNNLARYDLKARSWEVRQLPDFHEARLYGVDDSLYLFVTSGNSSSERETSIVRYDWDADKWNILASNRRRPARNQFDDTAPIVFFGGIFAGPDHKPCLSVRQGTYFIREDEGPWPEVFDGTFSTYPHSIGDRTLLCQNGEAVLLNADLAAPEYWVANSNPHVRKPSVNDTPPEKVPTPWANQANWVLPTSEKESLWQIGVGFHDETLFILEKPTSEDPLHLLCYQKGNNTPTRIPLEFHMDAATRAQLSFVPDTGSDLVRLSIEQLQHPEKGALERMHVYPQLIPTHQGLCIQFVFNGFWFLPFTDIDNYLKAHPAKP